MPTKSLLERLRKLRDTLEGAGRYQDLALALVSAANCDETILFAGGRWDHLDRCFLRGDRAERYVRIPLAESQVPFTRWFASFLRDYRLNHPRDIRLALAAGDRRGGKTFDTLFCVIAALIDVPVHRDGSAALGWAISRTFRERDELDQLIVNYLPRDWYHHQRAPEHRINFAHGSYLRNLSADDPEAMRQGRVDWLLYNEGQKMQPKAIVNGLYGTADRAGLTILACNPPSDPGQQWLSELKEAMDEDERFKRVSVFFPFDSKKNPFVDQPARRDVAMLADKILPDKTSADAEGIWRRWGDLAYPESSNLRLWRTLKNGGAVGSPPPGGLADITQLVTRRELGRPSPFVIGGDFQRQPEAAVVLRVLDSPDGPIYWFVHESQVKGDELALSASVIALARDLSTPQQAVDFPRDGVWIADCSGSFQGSERISGRTSFSLLEQHNWYVEAAELIRIPQKSEHPRNPLVGPRLNLMAELMKMGRIRVDPRCEILIAAFKQCQLRKTEYGKRVPKGRWAHITDAASYPIWRLEPKPTASRPPSRNSMKAVDFRGDSGFAGGGWY